MKLWKLFVIFLLSMPLYLFAAESTQNSTDTNKSQAVTQPKGAVKTQSATSKDKSIPQSTISQNLSSEEDDEDSVDEHPVEKKDIKSFANTTSGSRDFVRSLLKDIYLELPTKTDNQGIYTYLSEITNQYFAFSYMSKWTIGRDTIKDIPEDQQEEYLKVSKEYMILLYGEIFNTYYKQYVYTLGEVETKSDTQYDVKMIIEPKDKDPKNQDTVLNIVWKVKYSTTEKRFYIINVDIDGVLLLMTQQKQFKEMLKSQNGNFGDFLKLLSSKNTETTTRLGIVLKE